jgi:aminoglycoside 2'-N-acetyltransferase I
MGVVKVRAMRCGKSEGPETTGDQDVNPVHDSLELHAIRTSDMDEDTRESVVRLCIDAHHEDDFRNLFSYLPPEGLHVLAYLGDRLVGHAVATNRWLQAGNRPLLRTAYVDAVATSPTDQGRGIGSIVMRHLASVVGDFDIACLETERVGFYERLGWEEWRGPLGGRSADGIVPTPDQSGIMLLRLARTPNLDLRQLLTIEAHPAHIW